MGVITYLKQAVISIDNLLSLIAIIVAVIAYKSTNKTTNKNTSKTLNAKFFEEIFLPYIVKKLPSSLTKIENRLQNFENDCDELEDIITDMFKDMKFYMYFESEFYKKVKNILTDLDEAVTRLAEPSISQLLVDKYKKEISSSSEKLYKVLKEYYSEIEAP